MRHGGLVAAVAVAASLVLAESAAAGFNITATSITQPASLSHPLLDRDSTDTIHVEGTAAHAQAGDTVDIVCVRADGNASVLDSNVNVQTETFSDNISQDKFSTFPCVLRAVPTGAPTPAVPGQASPYEGPVILPINRQTFYIGSNSANPATDFQAGTNKSNGGWQFESAGGCVIVDSYLIDPATFAFSTDVFYCNAAFFDTNNGSINQGTRSQLVVDSRNAYLPYGAASVNHTAAHFPALDPPVFNFNADTGGATVHYVEKIVRCTGDIDPSFPANSGNCTDFVDTGVQLDTITTENADGTMATALQRFSSTDGKTHQIDALSEQEFRHETSNGGYRFPWADSTYQTYAAGATVTQPPAGSGSMFGKTDLNGTDGTLLGAQGAVTWAAAPESIKVTRGTSDANKNSEFELGYHHTITPSTPFWLGWSFALGTTPSAIAAAAHTAEVGFTPRVAITAPADGSSTTATTAHVTGTSGDDSGDPVTVAVNGHAATVGSGGDWSVDVPLAVGSNTLTAVATNRYGTTAGAQRSVTRTVVNSPAPNFTGASLKGVHTLTLDGAGDVTLKIGCPADAAGNCTGTASLVSSSPVTPAAKHKNRIKLGSKHFSIAPGKTGKVKIHITRGGRRYIKKNGKIRAKLTVTSNVGAGKSKNRTTKLTLRVHKAKKH